MFQHQPHSAFLIPQYPCSPLLNIQLGGCESFNFQLNLCSSLVLCPVKLCLSCHQQADNWSTSVWPAPSWSWLDISWYYPKDPGDRDIFVSQEHQPFCEYNLASHLCILLWFDVTLEKSQQVTSWCSPVVRQQQSKGTGSWSEHRTTLISCQFRPALRPKGRVNYYLLSS